MIRHVVMFRWRDDAPASEVAAAVEAIEGFRTEIPEVEALVVGQDLGLREGNFDLVVTVDVADAAAFRRYADDDHHQEVIRTRLRPLMESRAAVQFAL